MSQIRTYLTVNGGRTVNVKPSLLADGRVRVDYRDAQNVLIASELMSQDDAKARDALLKSVLPAPVVPTAAIYATPGGSDKTGTGTFLNPFLTVQRALDVAGPKGTAVLRGGLYPSIGSNGACATFKVPGQTLSNYPGETPFIQAAAELLYVVAGVNDTTITGIKAERLNGGNICELAGNNITLSYCDITNGNRGGSIMVGQHGVPASTGVVIKFNKLHHIGLVDGGNENHALYVQHCDGTLISHNTIWGGKGGWAIQNYSESMNTQIWDNTIVDNHAGIVTGNESGYHSDGTSIMRNIIAGNKGGIVNPNWTPAQGNAPSHDGITDWWGGTQGTGGVIKDNILWDNGPANINVTAGAWTIGSNPVLDPKISYTGVPAVPHETAGLPSYGA